MSKLDNVMRKINKEAKSDIINKGVQLPDVEKINFISPKLDYMLYGGLPMRRITEISGKENSGKTTTALGFCAMAQKQYPDKKVVYVDAETVLDENWAVTIGVDTEELILMVPEGQSGEQILEYIWDIIDTGEVSLVVLDSVPALTPKDQLDESIDKKTYAGISGGMTRFTRDVISKLDKNNTALLIINQLRDDISNPWANHRTPGGRALKHYSSLRLFTKKGKLLDENNDTVSRSYDNPSGHYVEVKMKKTKVCKPNRPYGSYTLNFIKGIDYIEDTIDIATIYDIIVRRGAWYYLVDPETGEFIQEENEEGELEEIKFQGKTNLKEELKSNEDRFNQIREDVNKMIKSNAEEQVKLL